VTSVCRKVEIWELFVRISDNFRNLPQKSSASRCPLRQWTWPGELRDKPVPKAPCRLKSRLKSAFQALYDIYGFSRSSVLTSRWDQPGAFSQPVVLVGFRGIAPSSITSFSNKVSNENGNFTLVNLRVANPFGIGSLGSGLCIPEVVRVW
jgi:hypothetical protein